MVGSRSFFTPVWMIHSSSLINISALRSTENNLWFIALRGTIYAVCSFQNRALFVYSFLININRVSLFPPIILKSRKGSCPSASTSIINLKFRCTLFRASNISWTLSLSLWSLWVYFRRRNSVVFAQGSRRNHRKSTAVGSGRRPS